MNRYCIEMDAETPHAERTRLACDFLRAVLRADPSLDSVEMNGIHSRLVEQNPAAVDLLLDYCEGIRLDQRVGDVITGTTSDATPATVASLELLSPSLGEFVLTDDSGRTLFARHDGIHHYFDATASEKEVIVAALEQSEHADRLRLSSHDPGNDN